MNEELNLISLEQEDSAVEDALPSMVFDMLPEEIKGACLRAGWANLMPVQEKTLPYMLARKDIVVQSRTGSGKTGAYLLPMLKNLNPNEHVLQALILVPTRELALQVEHEANILFEGTNITIATVYGGVGYDKQMLALKSGVTVVVGTPGRILDHLLRRSMSLDNITTLVFDEADRMLSIGFYPDMKAIQRYLPDSGVHSTLFSATYPLQVLHLADEFLSEHELLSLSGDQIHVAEIEHFYCECDAMEKDRVLLRIIQTENPVAAIVFCNTKANVHYITSVLKRFNISADELSADLTQKQRETVLNNLRIGKVTILVATDVAARGIDIPMISHVFLYEPPEDMESYIHRTGRTGRAGAAGTVITLVDVMQEIELDRIAKFYKIKMAKMSIPSEEDVACVLSQRMQTRLDAEFRTLSPMANERIAQLIPLATNLAKDEDNIKLLAMVLDDFLSKKIQDEYGNVNNLPIGTKISKFSKEKSKKTSRKRTSKERKGNISNSLNTSVMDESSSEYSDGIFTNQNFADINTPVADLSEKKQFPVDIPEQFLEFLDPEGFDLKEGEEYLLPLPQPRHRSKPPRKNRRFRR